MDMLGRESTQKRDLFWTRITMETVRDFDDKGKEENDYPERNLIVREVKGQLYDGWTNLFFEERISWIETKTFDDHRKWTENGLSVIIQWLDEEIEDIDTLQFHSSHIYPLLHCLSELIDRPPSEMVNDEGKRERGRGKVWRGGGGSPYQKHWFTSRAHTLSSRTFDY